MQNCYRLILNGGKINFNASSGKAFQIMTEPTNIVATTVYYECPLVCLPFCYSCSKWCCCNCEWVKRNHIEIYNNNSFVINNITIGLIIENENIAFDKLVYVNRFCEYTISEYRFDINISSLEPNEKFVLEFDTVRNPCNKNMHGSILANIGAQVLESDSSYINFSDMYSLKY